MLTSKFAIQWWVQGGCPRRAPPPPPTDQIFLNFMQFFRKSGKFVCWHVPPVGLAPLPTGNPGSAPVIHSVMIFLFLKISGSRELQIEIQIIVLDSDLDTGNK